MKIGIDISQYAYKGTGVARYTETLVKALTQYDKKNQYVFFYSSLRKPLDASLRRHITHPHELKEYKIPPSLLTLLWNTLRIFPVELFVGSVDIFMTSDWTEPPSRKALKITTIHDAVVYTHPETTTKSIELQHKKRHKLIAKESKMIFVDSLHTKADVIKYTNIASDKLNLLYPAVEVTRDGTLWDTVKNRYHIDSPYILTVGKLEPRKNIGSLIDAFNASELQDVQLLIVGDKGWKYKGTTTNHKVNFLGFVTDADLVTLYKHAEFFVLPSLYEGFGYPIVEAMGHGCPVACSENSSLQEVGKGAVYFFNPLKVSDISDALNRLHADKTLRTQLIKKGLARYKDFSLQKFAQNFVKIVQHT